MANTCTHGQVYRTWYRRCSWLAVAWWLSCEGARFVLNWASGRSSCWAI